MRRMSSTGMSAPRSWRPGGSRCRAARARDDRGSSGGAWVFRGAPSPVRSRPGRGRGPRRAQPRAASSRPGERREDPGLQTEHVEVGIDHQVAVAFGEAGHRHPIGRHLEGPSVGLDDTFRAAGRSRGEEDVRGIVAPDRGCTALELLSGVGGRERLEVVPPDARHPAGIRRRAARRRRSSRGTATRHRLLRARRRSRCRGSR